MKELPTRMRDQQEIAHFLRVFFSRDLPLISTLLTESYRAPQELEYRRSIDFQNFSQAILIKIHHQMFDSENVN